LETHRYWKQCINKYRTDIKEMKPKQQGRWGQPTDMKKIISIDTKMYATYSSKELLFGESQVQGGQVLLQLPADPCIWFGCSTQVTRKNRLSTRSTASTKAYSSTSFFGHRSLIKPMTDICIRYIRHSLHTYSAHKAHKMGIAMLQIVTLDGPTIALLITWIHLTNNSYL
jgi:hypothetical protein